MAGVFPPGLPVGVIAGEVEGRILAQTFVDWRNLAYVRLVDFGPAEQPIDTLNQPPVRQPPTNVQP